MATISVLDETSGKTYSVSLILQTAVVVGSGTGDNSFYFKMSTSAAAPDGASTPNYIITDEDIPTTSTLFTVPIETTLIRLMDWVSGGVLQSSSSSSSSKSSASSASSASSHSSGSSASS